MEERDNTELLKSIDERLARIEKRQLLDRRVRILKLCVVLSIIAVLAVILTPKITAAVDRYQQVMEQVDKISAVIDKLDMDELGDTLAEAQKIEIAKVRSVIDSLSKFNADAFNTALESINKTLEPFLNYIKKTGA